MLVLRCPAFPAMTTRTAPATRKLSQQLPGKSAEDPRAYYGFFRTWTFGETRKQFTDFFANQLLLSTLYKCFIILTLKVPGEGGKRKDVKNNYRNI